MASIIASESRPAIVGVFLATLVLAPWQHRPGFEVVRVPLDDVVRPPVVVAMELGAPYKGPLRTLVDMVAPAHPDVVDPGPHLDAQPWPRGMVIAPPPHPDQIAIDIPSALDKMLSGLVAPWRSTAI